MKTHWVVDQRHEYTSDPTYSVKDTYDEAVEVAHKFFLSYGFEVRDGKPFDGGNDGGARGDTGGFDCFGEPGQYKMHKGKVAPFMHCDGEGPVCRIEKAK